MQGGDVVLYQSINDGDIEIENGLVTMNGGLQSYVYLALFGGNSDDSNGSDLTNSWWGNISETDPEYKYRSETQNLLDELPPIPANLPRIRQAVLTDLNKMVARGIATEVEAVVSMPALNTVKIAISIDADDDVEFIENWKA